MAGSISTLGVGSGLQLQDILDQLRGIDEKLIDRQREQISTIKVQLDRFTKVNNLLLNLRSSALNLSLTSTFIGRTATSSNTGVLTATVAANTAVQSRSIAVTAVATRSTFQSGGMAAQSFKVYVPTSQESTTGVADPDLGTVMANGETLTITFGGTETIAITAVADLTMNELVAAINAHADNQDPGGPGLNGRHVTAETYEVGTETFLRIKTDTAGGTGEANRVAIAEDLASLAFAAPKELFSFRVGPSSILSINVEADTTLSQLKDLINANANNPGVTASIIDDGSATSPYRLILRTDGTGRDQELTFISQLPDLSMAVDGATGDDLNAHFTVDGISYQRQSNSSISDVIDGITLKLEGTGSSIVTIGDNKSTIIDLVSDLVKAYNGAVQAVRAEAGYDQSTLKFGALAGTTLRGLPHELQGLMTATVKTGHSAKVTTLFDLGLTFQRDGTISLDSAVLQQMVTDYPDDVEAFFLGDTDKNITGFADLVTDRMQAVIGSGGQIEAERTAAGTRIKDLELQIENSLARLDRRYEVLARQFVELDRYMNQMTSISNYLTSQFESMNKMWMTGNKNK